MTDENHNFVEVPLHDEDPKAVKHVHKKHFGDKIRQWLQSLKSFFSTQSFGLKILKNIFSNPKQGHDSSSSAAGQKELPPPPKQAIQPASMSDNVVSIDDKQQTHQEELVLQMCDDIDTSKEQQQTQQNQNSRFSVIYEILDQDETLEQLKAHLTTHQAEEKTTKLKAHKEPKISMNNAKTR
jgi:hypothetical protein